MSEIKNFEDASTATEQLFADDEQLLLPEEENPPEVEEQTAEITEPTAEPTKEVPVTEAPTEQQSELDNAAQVAETAAQAAAEQNAANQQLAAELEAARQQNAELQKRIEELSNMNAGQVVEEALEPPSPPDFHSLAFADEEAQKAAQDKYAAELVEYNRKQMMKELAPTLEFAKRGMYEQEMQTTAADLGALEQFADIEGMLPQLKNIIANNSALSAEGVPTADKLITAYLIAKGVNSMNNPVQPPKEPTPEELMAAYNSNPAFQELVEKQRLAQVKESQQVPPFSASSGAVNAALNIKNKPQTFEEASSLTRALFGAK